MRSVSVVAWSAALLGRTPLLLIRPSCTFCRGFARSAFSVGRGRLEYSPSTSTSIKGYHNDNDCHTAAAAPAAPANGAPSRMAKLLEECKRITTREITLHNKSTAMDKILQGLNSPAPQSFFILQRAVDRATRNHDNNEEPATTHHRHNHHRRELEDMLHTTAFFLVKRGYKLVLSNDGDDDDTSHVSSIQWKEAGASLPWNIVLADQDLSNTNWRDIIPKSTSSASSSLSSRHHQPTSTLQIANQILEIVTEASEQQVLLKSHDPRIKDLVHRAMEQLSWTLGQDLRGRTSADAAFVFALAGVRNEELFQSLACLSRYELMRVGTRPSFCSKYVLQIVEKHAAAGSKDTGGFDNSNHVKALYEVAAACLQEKGEHLELVDTLMANNNNNSNDADANTIEPSLDLLSPRPLLWLWRFSARQRKAKGFSPSTVASSESDTSDILLSTFDDPIGRPPPTLPNFQDSKRPLIVDLGCGMGTSLLGLATTTTSDSHDIATLLGFTNFQACNFLGADLSQLAMGFATGVTARWGLHDKLQYAWTTAEECLDMVEKSYEGQVAFIMIQFPTPYRLVSARKSIGNSQLPSDFQSGFMVSDALLAQVARILSQSGGKLLVQSNCEDVAVTVRRRATTHHGMKCVDVPHEVSMENVRQTLRNTEWIKLGGERAMGPGWSSAPLLPERGSTETEVACHLQGTPIHRCLLSC